MLKFHKVNYLEMLFKIKKKSLSIFQKKFFQKIEKGNVKTDKLIWKETSVAFGTISVLERYKLSPGCI